jgi:hypothetical protein
VAQIFYGKGLFSLSRFAELNNLEGLANNLQNQTKALYICILGCLTHENEEMEIDARFGSRYFFYNKFKFRNRSFLKFKANLLGAVQKILVLRRFDRQNYRLSRIFYSSLS